MTPIGTHTYRTPSSRNPEGVEQWSIGVLNVTQDECLLIQAFANKLQTNRGDDERVAFLKLEQQRKGRSANLYGADGSTNPYIPASDAQPTVEPEGEPETFDRFQGLDLG